MKQNIPTAKYRTQLLDLIAIILVALILSALACATLPRKTSPEVELSLDSRASEKGLQININAASARELEQLPGVGKVIAERIVGHREQHGPFRRPEHLMMVRGISDRKFRAIRAMIIVD